MYEMIIVGAGPAGISMAAEARTMGILSEQILVLEKGDTHSWAIRKFYPAEKVVLANYKGIEAVCTGVMCISDMSKEQVEEDVDKRARILFAEMGFPPQSFAHIIYALGGTTPTNFLKAIGIAFDGSAPIVKEGYETSVLGLYLIGDLSAGKKGGSINLAFNMAAEAMRSICGRSPEVCDSQ